jgi:hypothetical protein
MSPARRSVIRRLTLAAVSFSSCIAYFRPALVFHPRRGQEYRITAGPGTPEIFAEVIHPF